MQIKIKYYFLVIIIGALFWKCSETKELNPDDLGTNYYPLNVGDYRIYNVSGVEYISTADSVEFSYMLKESVVDSFMNLESGISYKIQREKKYTEDGLWELDSIWTARKDNRTAVQVENNVPIIKLSFPMSENLRWDGNRLNGNYIDEFILLDFGQTYVDDFGFYSNTATVEQEYIPDTRVNWISMKEVYAEDIGLVYKENVKIDFRIEPVFLNLRYYQHLVEWQ